MRLSAAAFHTVMNDRNPADAVTLTAPAAKGRALLAAAVASTVKDPDILNNVTLIPIRVG
jgi:hypothetical protein